MHSEERRPAPRIFTIEELDALCRVDTRVRPLDVVPSDADFDVQLYWPDPERKVAEYLKPVIDMCRERRELVEPYWTPQCDEVLREAVAKCGTNAGDVLCDLLRKTWGEAKFAALREEASKRGETISGLHGIIGDYGMARAGRLGFSLQQHIRRCLYCDEEFSDADPLLGGPVDSYSDVCVTCHHLAFQILLPYAEGNPVKDGFPTDRDYLSRTLRVLCQVLEQVVSSDYLRHAVKALQAGHAKKKAIIAALVPIQPAEVYNRVFGSWLQALKDSGLLDPDARRGTYGVRCLAEDGHECESLAEKNIDDWLFRHGVIHDRAPDYPRTARGPQPLKADWAIGGALVEYWGRKGSEDYDAKMKTKRAIAKSAGVKLIEIGPEDLWNPDPALCEKFQEWV
jgi:hypothetical protein